MTFQWRISVLSSNEKRKSSATEPLPRTKKTKNFLKKNLYLLTSLSLWTLAQCISLRLLPQTKRSAKARKTTVTLPT